jgi:hypothetical protein
LAIEISSFLTLTNVVTEFLENKIELTFEWYGNSKTN